MRKDNLTEEDLQNIEYDVEFFEFYEKNISNNETLAKEIYKETFDIVESRETNTTSEDSAEWIARIKNLFDFDGERSSRVYVLKQNSVPVSFALLSSMNDEEKRWNLELVMSHADFSSNNFAEKLIEKCFDDLSKNGELQVVAIVENDNKASISLHEKLKNICPTNLYIDERTKNICYSFDISVLKSNNQQTI